MSSESATFGAKSLGEFGEQPLRFVHPADGEFELGPEAFQTGAFAIRRCRQPGQRTEQIA